LRETRVGTMEVSAVNMVALFGFVRTA
jgi:hypothetical protein